MTLNLNRNVFPENVFMVMPGILDQKCKVLLMKSLWFAYNTTVLAAKKIKSGPLGPLVDEPGNMEAKCL